MAFRYVDTEGSDHLKLKGTKLLRHVNAERAAFEAYLLVVSSCIQPEKEVAVRDLSVVPPNLPVPSDDGAAAHLRGMRVPSVPLTATDGTKVELSAQVGTVVVFAYPRTGRPGESPLVEDWDMIPGARGCTPHTCAFRDSHAEFAALGAGLRSLDPRQLGST